MQYGEGKPEEVKLQIWPPAGAKVPKGGVAVFGHVSGASLYRQPELRRLASKLQPATFAFVGNTVRRGFLPKCLLYEPLKNFDVRTKHS